MGNAWIWDDGYGDRLLNYRAKRAQTMVRMLQQEKSLQKAQNREWIQINSPEQQNNEIAVIPVAPKNLKGSKYKRCESMESLVFSKARYEEDKRYNSQPRSAARQLGIKKEIRANYQEPIRQNHARSRTSFGINKKPLLNYQSKLITTSSILNFKEGLRLQEEKRASGSSRVLNTVDSAISKSSDQEEKRATSPENQASITDASFVSQDKNKGEEHLDWDQSFSSSVNGVGEEVIVKFAYASEQNKNPLRDTDSDVGSMAGGRGIFTTWNESEDEIFEKFGILKPSS